jgi:hypothetical protein
MSIINNICLTLFLCFMLQTLWAQETLEPVEDAASILSGILGGDKGISEVRLVTSTEQGATVEVDYKGFKGNYQVRGLILNRLKKSVEQISSEPQQLTKADGTIELRFQLGPGTENYTNNVLETHFVAIVFSKTDSILSGIDLGDQNVLGETYLYKMNKRWRVGGNESMVVTVKLTPFKSATSIQP